MRCRSQLGHIVEDSWSAWGELAWAVRTGDSAFKKSHNGKTIWEYLKVHLLWHAVAPSASHIARCCRVQVQKYMWCMMWTLDLDEI